jgi:AAA family ATP:ADP antiporter
MQRLLDLLLIKEGERRQVLYYLALFLVLGAGLALGRGSMDALFLKHYGFQYLPVMYGVLSVFLAALSLGYAAWVDRLPSERFFQVLLGTLVVLLAASWVAMNFTDLSAVYPFYFLVYEVASELLLLHAMFYMSQNFETQELKRLSPLIFAGAQVGTVIGGLFLGLAAKPLGVANMLLVWCALLAAAAAMILRYHRRIGTSPYFRPGRKGRGGVGLAVEQVTQGLKFFRRSELVRASSFALFFMVMAFFILCYSVHRIYAASFASAEDLGAFYGWLTAFTSAAALAIQLLVTNRLLQRVGVKQANLVFPAAGALSYVALLASFTLPSAILASFTKDALLPAVRRPTRNIYLNALPEAMQGRIRALAVALVMPAALVAVSALLLLAQRYYQPVYFLAGGLAASLLYIYFKLRVNRAYGATLIETLRERLFLPPRLLAEITADGGHELYQELARGVESADEEMSLAYARLLIESFPERAAPVILRRLERASVVARDRLLRLLIEARADLSEPLRRLLKQADDHLRATVLEVLFDRRDERARELVPDCLGSANPRLVAVGILGAYSYGLREFEEPAARHWERLLASETSGELVAGLELFARYPASALRERLPRLLDHACPRVRKAALRALGHLPVGVLPHLGPVVQALYAAGDAEIRSACVAGYRLLPEQTRRRLCFEALEDGHPLVREAALELLFEGDETAAEDIAEWLVQNRGSPRAQRAALEALLRHRPPRALFERLVEAKIEDAERYAAVRAALAPTGSLGTPGEPGDPALLRIVLEERRGQMIELALLAMESLENPIAVATVREGLASSDRRQRAHAAEALRHLGDRRLAARLGRLLDGTAPAAGPESGRAALARLSERTDAWLRECAERVAAPARA